MYASILKYNPYHAADGTFASSDGAASHSGAKGARNLTRGDAMPHKVAARSVQSTAPSKEEHRDKIDADFDSLEAQGSRVYLNSSFNGVKDAAQVWDEAFPGVLPSQMLDAIHGGGAGMTRIFLRQDGVKIEHTGTIHGAEGTVTRMFHPEKGVVDHSYLSLQEGSQGAGVVKKMFADSIPLYQKAGYREIEVYANLDRGGYAWGRYGFKPKDTVKYSDDAMDGYKDTMKRMDKNIEYLKMQYNSPALSESRALRQLMKAHEFNPNIAQILSHVKTPELDKLGRASKTLTERETFVSGMLKHKNWEGSLSLSDAGQMAILSEYVGKKLPPSKT